MFGRGASSLFCLALLAVQPALAQTAADGPDYWAVTGVRSDDALNLRVAPNADSRRIARILGRSEHTIKNQVRRVYSKLGIHTRVQAVRIADRLLQDDRTAS